MKRINFWKLSFAIIVLIDTLGIWFPTIINREFTTYLPIPFLIVWYLYSQKNWNVVYLIASIFTFMGVCLFNMHYVEERNLGMLCYSSGVLLYLVLLWPQVSKIKIQRWVLNMVVVSSLFWGVVVSNFSITTNVLYLFVYGWLVSMLFASGIMVFFNQKNRIAKTAFIATTLFAFGTFNTAIDMFSGTNRFLQTVTIFTFGIMHYSFQRYVIVLRAEKKDYFIEL